MPGPPGADLVVVQPGLSFGLLEAFLDTPPASRDPGQVSSGGPARPVAGVVGDVPGVVQGPAGQQPVPAAWPGSAGDRDPRPAGLAWPVRAGSGGDPLPGP